MTHYSSLTLSYTIKILSCNDSWLFRNHSFATGTCAKTKACSEARNSFWASNESGRVRGFFKLQSGSIYKQYLLIMSRLDDDVVCRRNRTVVFPFILTNPTKQRDSKPNSNLNSSRTPAKNRSSNWSPASSTALLAPLQPPNPVVRSSRESRPIFSATRKLNNPNADLDSGEGNTQFHVVALEYHTMLPK